MREYKFRGKTTYSKDWVYGDLINYSETEKKILEQNFRQWDILEGGIDVVPETVGQLTPFKDSEGTPIFEGDIIGDWTEVDGVMEESRLTVFFDEMLGQWMLDNSLKQDRSLSYSLFQELNDFKYKVIGNIYQK